MRCECALAFITCVTLVMLPSSACGAQNKVAVKYRFQTHVLPHAHPKNVVGVKYWMGDAKAAMPLGGLGTGTVYFGSDGAFFGNSLTGNVRPNMSELIGSFFAVWCEANGKRTVRILKARSQYPVKPIANLTYLGHFPMVDIDYIDDALPCRLSLCAFSPFIYRDSKRSGTPAGLFEFLATNPTDEPMTISVAFSWRNDVPIGIFEALAGVSENVDGALVWRKAILPPNATWRVLTIQTLGATQSDALNELARARKFAKALVKKISPVAPRAKLQVRDNAPAGPMVVTLTNSIIEFCVDKNGGFNWEPFQRQTMRCNDEGNIGQVFWFTHYRTNGERHRAGIFMGGRELSTRCENLKLVTPTQIADANARIAITKLRTTDGALTIHIRTVLGDGKFVVREFTITNISRKTARDVELHYYVNYDIGGPMQAMNGAGKFDDAHGAIVIVNRKTSACGIIAGLEAPYGFLLGTWPRTWQWMTAGRKIELTRWRKALRERTYRTPEFHKRASIASLTWHADEHSGYTIGVIPDESIEVSWISWARNATHHFWDDFCDDGAFSNRTIGGDGMAIAAKAKLQPGESRKIRFVLAWYFPEFYDSDGKFIGRMYSNWFANSFDVANYVARHFRQLARDIAWWQGRIYRARIPDWLKDALVNSLYSLARNTMWIKDGRFAHSESFRGCPITETIVCRFYGSIATAMFFPDLERNTMRQFAHHQRNDGAIPFAFGRPECFDKPYYGTQKSIDSSEFVLMVYRDVVWWGDLKFLREMYPHVKRAIAFARTLDTDGDGIVNEVSMQYYDCWRFYGTSTYVGSIWLAALKAAQRMAVIMGDHAFERECGELFLRARENFEKKLWNGRYYRLYNEPGTGRVSETSLGNQLVGQWYAYLCGLGEILPKEHILSALRWVAKLNGSISPYGLVNGVTPDGKVDTTGRHGHSSTITIGETFCYAATCIYAGVPEVGLPFAKRLYENIALRQRTPWNTTWNMHLDGRLAWGTEYYSNMCIWDLWGALTGMREL